ncbi:MAG: DUF4089 domain-containing protein [Jaaginema sp. PMC 1079.18]|nr:DUF4089 domain-containing protein [Jaaginema sp. PMC 1080.18]MEC4851052.1 DUF4089 domain-containing protein [Jaaginema sp. PMC 1079.18]MEC4866037.1 DUF4089 domain-containing protein [Jaaginema sp. PMC 1078.18]
MSQTPINYEQYVEQMANLMALSIPEVCLPGVIENLERMAIVAEKVAEFPLTEIIEPAAIFEP